MKMLCLILSVTLLHGGNAVAFRAVKLSRNAASLESKITLLVDELVEADEPSTTAVMKEAGGQLDLKAAVEQLGDKLPAEVSSLVNLAEDDAPALTEESMAKARVILNGMIETAYGELDQVLTECVEFKNRNRGTMTQVRTDISRLGQEAVAATKLNVEATKGIQQQEKRHGRITIQLDQETTNFQNKEASDETELRIRKSDLAVFEFLLEATRCKTPASASLAQTGVQVVSANEASANSTHENIHVCSSEANRLELRFDDPALEKKLEGMMTERARKTIHEALSGQIWGVGLAQISGSPFGKKTKKMNKVVRDLIADRQMQKQIVPPATVDQELPVIPQPRPMDAQRVALGPPCCTNSDGKNFKCTDGKPNCGLLHDTMAMHWGEKKDLVDELSDEMANDATKFKLLQKNLNSQLSTCMSQTGTWEGQFQAAVGDYNAAMEESSKKNEQKLALSVEYQKECKVFKSKIKEILFTNICGVRSVRDQLLKNSKVSNPEGQLQDCSVGDWNYNGACSTPCDNTCPKSGCGGQKQLTRVRVTDQDETGFGISCDALPLKRAMKCGQKKCERDCGVSMWGSFSSCSKECGGGSRTQARTIMHPALNGGKSCPVTTKSQNCHMGSCRRDCELDSWTEWSPCSQACTPKGSDMSGEQLRIRKVIRPIRGDGKCPKVNHRTRLDIQTCNKQECVGDEVCVAKQDLIIAIDASGSLKQSGFEIVKNFAMNITDKLRSNWQGDEAVKVGVIIFGNGKIMKTGTIAPAKSVFEKPSWSTDMSAVKTAIDKLSWQRGFTNLAQVFVLAASMFTKTGRTDAQNALLVITDGKIPFFHVTKQKAQVLKDNSAAQVLMAVVSESVETKVLKLAGPGPTNSLKIPGLFALKTATDQWARQVITTFCPLATSPVKVSAQEDMAGYVRVKKSGMPDGSCGTFAFLPTARSEADCFAEAQEKGANCFSFSSARVVYFQCRAHNITASDAVWAKWKDHTENPPCGDNGGWIPNMYFDTFCAEPV